MRYQKKQSSKNESYRNKVLNHAVPKTPSETQYSRKFKHIKRRISKDILVVSDVSNAQVRDPGQCVA